MDKPPGRGCSKETGLQEQSGSRVPSCPVPLQKAANDSQSSQNQQCRPQSRESLQRNEVEGVQEKDRSQHDQRNTAPQLQVSKLFTEGVKGCDEVDSLPREFSL